MTQNHAETDRTAAPLTEAPHRTVRVSRAWVREAVFRDDWETISDVARQERLHAIFAEEDE